MTREDFYRRYAEIVIKVGLNIQPNQELYIRAPVEAADFTPYVTAAAYRAGARYVHVDFRHQGVTKARILHAPESSLSYIPPGMVAERLRVGREGGASLAILGDDPMGMKDVPVPRRGQVMRAMAKATEEIKELQMKDYFPWCVISVPTEIWASRVFPDLQRDTALERLIDAVAVACRLDEENPVAAWQAHSTRLMKIAGWLTSAAFDRFIYSAPGTELTVGMPDDQNWIGTEGSSAGGTTFIANLPTDEVFSAPHRLRVDGIVRSTRPLILGGIDVGIVDLRIEKGRIIEARSEQSNDVLQQELDLDENARFLGEIALVSENAPIARLGTTFYDGLYDENAGCHLAFGAAYSNCISGGANMTPDARKEAGLNQSSQHADFTVGSTELSITAVREDGTEFPLMRNGRWTPETVEAANLSERS